MQGVLAPRLFPIVVGRHRIVSVTGRGRMDTVPRAYVADTAPVVVVVVIAAAIAVFVAVVRNLC